MTPAAPHRRTVRGVTRRSAATSSARSRDESAVRSSVDTAVVMGHEDRCGTTPHSGTFRFPSGADVSSSERDLLREQEAAWLLIGALGKRPEFWDHADAIATAPDPFSAAHVLSLRYCQGKRRRVIERVLLRAAAAPHLRTCSTQQHRISLVGARACVVSRDHPSATMDVGSEAEAEALATANPGVEYRAPSRYGPITFHVALDRPGQRQGRYAVGSPFVVPLLEASHLVAARGAGVCVGRHGDGSPCTQCAAHGSTYCRRHDSHSARPAWESRHDTIVRRLFALATPAVMEGACEADWSVEWSTAAAETAKPPR